MRDQLLSNSFQPHMYRSTHVLKSEVSRFKSLININLPSVYIIHTFRYHFIRNLTIIKWLSKLHLVQKARRSWPFPKRLINVV
jgi:hypothetical protein